MRTSFLLILLISFFKLSAQSDEKKSSWTANISFSHFNSVEKVDYADTKPDYGFNVSPGLELLYNFQVLNNISISSGIFYQYINLTSLVHRTDKFMFGELNVPFMVTLLNKSPFSFQIGTYFGKIVHFDWEYYVHAKWENAIGGSYYEQLYSDQNSFMDLYFGIPCSIKLNNGRDLAFTPFVKYRFKENWMEYYKRSINYGFKILINLGK